MTMLLTQTYNSLKKMAINNVLKSDSQFYVEQCYRYYSKTYCTPLDVAKQLPVEEVVLVYLEDFYKDYKVEELAEMLKDFEKHTVPVLAPGKEETSEEDTEASDEAWIAKMNAELKEQEKMSSEEIMDKTHQAIEDLKNKMNTSGQAAGMLGKE